MDNKPDMAKIKEIIDTLVSVKNMSSPSMRGGEVPNQFILRGKDWTLFQSYKSPIALKKNGKTYIFHNWDYSKTTGKYRNDFLGETKKDTERKLKSGEYIAVDFEVDLI